MSICPMCEREWEGWDQASLDTREYFQERGVHLTGTEGRIVAALIKKGRPVSLGALTDVLWGDDIDGGPESADNNIKVAVSKIRKKTAGLSFGIETIWGKGYVAKNAKSLEDFPSLKVMAYMVLIPLFLIFPVMAIAQTICGDNDQIAASLAKYGEKRVSIAFTEAGKLMERYENPANGTWTLIVHPDGSHACVFATGSDWHNKRVSTDPEA